MRTTNLKQKGDWKVVTPDHGINGLYGPSTSSRGAAELRRNLREASFLARFCSVINASLEFEAVCGAAAQALYEFFSYDCLVMSFAPSCGDTVLSFASPEYAPRLTQPELFNRVGSAGSGVRQAKQQLNSQADNELHAGGAPMVLELPGGFGRMTFFSAKSGMEQVSEITVNTMLASFSQAARNALEHRMIRDLSMRDALTGLYNRRVLEEMMAIEDKKRDRADCSVLLVDLDNFKMINDTYGHAAGDRVIQRVAGILKECTRGADIVARYGGEEFAVLLPETSAKSAMVVGERFRRMIADTVIVFEGHEIRPTASIGGACRQAGETLKGLELVHNSDLALYRAKRTGKNRVCMFEWR